MSSEEGIADVSVKEILHPVTAQDNVVHENPKETHHITLMNKDPATVEGKIPQDTSKVKGSPVVLDESIVPETEYKEVNNKKRQRRKRKILSKKGNSTSPCSNQPQQQSSHEQGGGSLRQAHVPPN